MNLILLYIYLYIYIYIYIFIYIYFFFQLFSTNETFYFFKKKIIHIYNNIYLVI